MHGKQSIWTRLTDLITGSPERLSAAPVQALRVTERGLRLPLDGQTFEVTMGKRRLHVSPDLALSGDDRKAVHDLMVFYPDRFFGRIGRFARLAPWETLSINPSADGPEPLFTSPNDALRSSIQLRHEGDTLVLKSTPEPAVFVATLAEGVAGNRILAERRRALPRIAAIYGARLAPFPPEAALALLERVNRLLEEESYRPAGGDGRPGGIVELPARKTPIVVGDLHGRVDNLLSLLVQNSFLESLEKEQAALVFLGDAVHPEGPEALEDMQGSMLIMDVILRLKLRFPDGVFFLLGNHDSFSAELMKDGVAQGMLWDRWLCEQRGAAYRDAMQRFYTLCPLLLVSDGLVACHAGAPRMSYSHRMLVDVGKHPTLLYELTWNRQKTRGQAGGYTGADVRRLFQVLGLPDDSTFVVGHYPRSEFGSVWLDAGGIPRHHVLVSSRPTEVAVMTRVDGEFVAQTYAPERLIPWLNAAAAQQHAGLVRAGGGEAVAAELHQVPGGGP